MNNTIIVIFLTSLYFCTFGGCLFINDDCVINLFLTHVHVCSRICSRMFSATSEVSGILYYLLENTVNRAKGGN